MSRAPVRVTPVHHAPGYTVTADGAAAWSPAWSYAPLHRLTPPGATPEHRRQAIEAHAARIAAGASRPQDWPRFLIQRMPGGPAHPVTGKPQPWRRVPLSRTGRRLVSRATWHASFIQALFS